MSLCIVIPMKDPSQSKSRLSSVLDNSERQSLALNLFRQTLAFLCQHFPQLGTLVVTPANSIAAIAGEYGCQVLLEPAARGLNSALDSAAVHCTALGYSSQLVLPADIVALDQREFERLLDCPRETPSVVICPALDGGTNALLSTPPQAIPFSYGNNSSLSHYHSAKQLNVARQFINLDKLALDLDNPSDLQRLGSSLVAQLKSSQSSYLNHTTVLNSSVHKDLAV
ncbi:MAG: hypothetical protein OFPI_41860 [Osedax symbiont Rs2]|nr:MAG: hypothetical protein OFPI_41860 [Osedax symbiont Rs2]